MKLKGKDRQTCVCCGREEGGWDAIHNRTNSTTGSRTCPFKGINCTNCKRYDLLAFDTDEKYTNHTSDACPLHNMAQFADKLAVHLSDKHEPDRNAPAVLGTFE